MWMSEKSFPTCGRTVLRTNSIFEWVSQFLSSGSCAQATRCGQALFPPLGAALNTLGSGKECGYTNSRIYKAPITQVSTALYRVRR